MANVLINENSLTNVANSIRTKLGTSSAYTVSQMSTAILDIPSGGSSWTPIKDGKTRFTVIVEEDTKNITVMGLIVISGATASIDWGDGTIETITTSQQDMTHTYEDIGEYTIILNGEEATIDIGHDTGTSLVTNGTSYCVKYMTLGTNLHRVRGYHQNDYALKGFYGGKIKYNSVDYLLQQAICDGCSNLIDVIIENGITTIRGFQDCPAIQNLVLPNDLNNIYQYAFRNSRVSETISLTDETSISIGDYAFANSTNLRFLSLNAPTLSFNPNAFKDCKALKKVTLAGTSATYGSYMFSGCSDLISINLIPSSATTLPSSMFASCSSLTNITVPNGITSLGASAFDGCSSLTTVSLPASLTSLNSYVFRGCTSLENLVIPEGVTSIPTYCFSGCTGLKNITLPSTITSILGSSFANCNELEEVHVGATTPPTLNNSFGTFGSAIIYVPVGTLADYQAVTKWSTYASQMQEES